MRRRHNVIMAGSQILILAGVPRGANLSTRTWIVYKYAQGNINVGQFVMAQNSM